MREACGLCVAVPGHGWVRGCVSTQTLCWRSYFPVPKMPCNHQLALSPCMRRNGLLLQINISKLHVPCYKATCFSRTAPLTCTGAAVP